MPYVSCPRCELTFEGRYAYTMESCPRCLGREGKRVALEAHLGDPDRDGRFVEAVRSELVQRGGVARRPPPAP